VWGGGGIRPAHAKEEEGGQWGQLAAGLIGPEPEKNIFGIKIRFLNLIRLWKFAQGDLGGILTQWFFLNSSRILKDFRKIQYVMP
jgi:hypothetical protein